MQKHMQKHTKLPHLKVRSMPTFVFLLDGKKVHEFSGAGEQQLRQFTEQIVNKSRRNNIKVTEENLVNFYAGEQSSETETETEIGN